MQPKFEEKPKKEEKKVEKTTTNEPQETKLEKDMEGLKEVFVKFAKGEIVYDNEEEMFYDGKKKVVAFKLVS